MSDVLSIRGASGPSVPAKRRLTWLGRLRVLMQVLAVLLGVGAMAGPAAAQNEDLVVNLTDAGYDPIAAGGTIIYAASVANSGNTPSAATTLTLSIPAGTTYTGGTGTITGCTAAPVVGPGTVVCPIPVLAASAAVNFNAQVRTSVQGSVSLDASVPGTAAANTDSEPTTVTAGADISLLMTAPATVSSGGQIVYQITATNNGPDAATNVKVQFPVPTGVANVSPPAGCTLTGSTYNCTIAGPIAPNGTASLSFSGQVSAAGGSNVAAIATTSGGTPTDPVSTNNQASQNTTVTAGSDLTIAKSRSPSGPLLVGDNVTFTLTPSYSGDSPNGIVVTDTLPSNYQIATPITAPGWTCTVTGQAVSCTRTSGSGAGANVSLGTISIPAKAISSGSAINSASITSASPNDPNPANNTANDGGASITDPTVDLVANKSGPNPALVVVGNSYAFSISTTNSGNAAFYGTAVMTDMLPAGLEATSYTENGWTCLPAASVAAPVVGPATITCSRVYTAASPLAAGATTPSVVMITKATANSTIANSMTVSSPDANIADVNHGNDTITYTVTGSTQTNSADISLTKTATLATLPAGDIQTFTLRINNAGPTAATNITLTDDLMNLINSNVGATGAGFIDAVVAANSATGVSCTSASSGGTSRLLTCTVNNLPVCSGATCPEITVRVRPGGDAGARSNAAMAVSSTTADPDLENNRATVPYAIEARADVTVTKTDSPDPATAGQTLTYVITATNIANGLSAADAVTITDTLPSDVTFLSATPSAGSCSTTPAANSITSPTNNQIVCNLGTISNGAQQTVNVAVRPNLVTRGTTLHNSVSVATSTTETDGTNNTASADTVVNVPVIDLLINKDDTVDPLTVGDDTVYTVTVTNLGPSAAENVVMTDTMPVNRVSYRSYTAPADATCGTVPTVDSLGGTLQCSFPSIPAGESRVILITGRGVAKGTATNNASVTSDEGPLGYEPNAGNNTASEGTTVRTRVDMEVASKVATPSTVNLRDPFSYLVTVRNNTGSGLAEADDVSVSDTLPSGMELTGAPSVTVISGTTTANSCTGSAGSTSFSCSLGTVSLGAQLTISVPVRVVTATSPGQTFTNTATVSTSSYDAVPANNSNSGPVVVNSSSLAGTVFRDFANDGAVSASDTGISGILMTLTGTAFDGTPISLAVNTTTDGSFTFGQLPEGSYTISQGAITEAYLTNGSTGAGTSGGTVAPTVISSISLDPATAATGYLFPKVPQARIGIAKSVQAGPTVNSDDGSFNVTFRLTVTNFSLEALNAVQVTDTLSGASPLFGSYSASTPTLPGTYTLVSSTGSCGGLNAGFNGAGDTTVASAATLAAGASCTIDLQLRVMPTNPLPPVLAGGERYRNQAEVEGTGALSGQDRTTNPQLTDLSDSGTNADPNGNGQGNETGENDPTPVGLTLNASISLIKSLASITDTTGDGQTGAGDTATYTFTVTNTGQIALANVTVTDPLVTVSGGPISLGIGAMDSGTFTASYVLTQADLDRGYVENTATVRGKAVTSTGADFLDDSGNPVTVSDVSDSGTDPDGGTVTNPEGTETQNGTGGTDGDPTNDPTVAKLTPTPRIVLEKSLVSVTDTTGDGQIGKDDTATYSFKVTNTGPLALANVTVTDPVATVSGGPISLDIGAFDTGTFSATYVLTQADVDRGYARNSATVTGEAVTATGTPILDGTGAPVQATDVSDTGTAHDGSTVSDPATTETPDGDGTTDADPTNDPTIAIIVPSPRIVLVKRLTGLADTNGDGLRNAGDTASYEFDVSNTGTVTLANVTISDPLVTVTGGPATIAVGTTDSTTFEATYVVTQADVDRGYVDNSATVNSIAATEAGTPILDGSGNQIPVSDVSDTGTAPDGTAVTDPATTETPSGAGTTDSDPTNDPTPLLLSPDPRITLVKSVASIADTTGDGQIGAGDTVSYTFSVTNSGNLALQGVTVSDPLVTVTGGPVDLAIGATDTGSFTASYILTQDDLDRGYVENTAIATGDAVTDNGTPILDGSGNPVQATDTSDAGTDNTGTAVPDPETTETPDGTGATDGDPTNDPTVALIAPTPRIVLIKRLVSLTDTNGNGVIGVGDTASYAFAVHNTGTLALANVTVSDPLVTVSGGPINLAINGQDTATFTASYILTQDDVDRGYVENTATVTGDAVTSTGAPILDGSGNPVQATDVSDTGTAPDGSAIADPAVTETPDGAGGTDADPTNDPTVALIAPEPSIRLIKRITGTTDTNGNGYVDLGDVVLYAFDVENTGSVTLTGVMVSDPMFPVSGAAITLAVGETKDAAFTGSFTLVDDDITRTYVQNSATVTGNAVTVAGTPILDGSGHQIQVTDVSDTGTDPTGATVTDPDTTETPDGLGNTDTDPTNDPTVIRVGVPEIQLDIAILDIPDTNGNGIIDAGDQILYTFTVTNTGDVDLVNVNMDYTSLSLPLPGLTCTPISLAIGASQTLTCTGNAYTITAADVATGTVTLSGTATGASRVGQVVSDDDSVVSPTFGLGGLTITKTVDRGQANPGEEVTYTITVTNTSTDQTTVTNVVDVLPSGFLYQPGTATVDGVASEPIDSGRRLTWENVSLPPGDSAVIVLNVLISANAKPGDHDNVARAVSPITGAPVTADAIATVRIAADPVFACSTIIGRVFDDLNQDGYFNGEPKEAHRPVTDQAYHGDKWGAVEAPAEVEAEKGLPGVRLVAPNGLAVTTDAHGRYSIPCSALPSDIGSNFMLKLDTRTLPSGYRLTTENPRVVRVTPGMLTKMNFGATISRVVRVDLSDRAFGKGDAARQPRKELVDGLKAMVTKIADTPTMLRISYQLAQGESEKLARQRMREVERLLRKLWPANGRYQLNVETVIQRGKTVNE